MDQSFRPLTLGTAGHIDHGKTTLVKALTGRDTDRLKEEKERGISIELGFAELTLPSGRHLSVVDVPGHERFVKTMVAGATGIDLFLLVVAADDGVMPQTREHLRIIELLDIPLGLVAVTKVDMVDPELAELALADVEEFLAQTRYAGAPVALVSGATGEGLPELLAILNELGARVPLRPAYPATRLPVDRVFSLKGIGTVVTGTLWSGSISAEDTVAILPPPVRRGMGDLVDVRVRSVQVHDREVAEARGGQRVALNLTGIEREEVARGQWVVKDPVIEPTYLADVRVHLLADEAGALPRVSRARVDHGTAEILVKVVLADREALQPGDSCYAQLRFEERALVYPGDQFILRSITPVTTIGGGRVVDPAPHKHGTGSHWHDRLALLEEGSPDAIATLLLEESFPAPWVRGRLETSPYLWRFSRPEIGAALAAILADGRALPAGAAGSDAVRLLHGARLRALEEAARAAIMDRAETDALNPYRTLGDLRRQLAGGREWPALDSALERLVAGGDILRTEHGFVSAVAAAAAVGSSAEAARLLEEFVGAGPEGAAALGAETPSVAMAATAAGLSPAAAQKLIDALVRQGGLVKVGEDLYYPADRLEDMMGRLATAMEETGQLTLAEARDLLGTSRRYAQALLEHMDSEGLTLRVGDPPGPPAASLRDGVFALDLVSGPYPRCQSYTSVCIDMHCTNRRLEGMNSGMELILLRFWLSEFAPTNREPAFCRAEYSCRRLGGRNRL
jgi:selenocysteine-specific elongation factor